MWRREWQESALIWNVLGYKIELRRDWWIMHIVMCEDEEYWQDQLCAAVLRWAALRNVSVAIHVTSTACEFFECVRKEDRMDGILLDIALNEEQMDGISIASRIRKMGISMPIIFVTGDADRAVDGYLVEAFGYIVKPIDDKRLFLYLDRIYKARHNVPLLRIETDHSVTAIQYSDSVYMEG
jgi:DNA-binding LytR/AlgR family response regulator